MRLTVATTPKWRAGRPSLAEDIELVKAGILYADDVELVGLAASLVHKVSLTDESKQLPLERFLRITQLVTGEDLSLPPGMSWADLRRAEKVLRQGGGDDRLRQQWEKLDGLRRGGEPHLRASQEAVLRSSDAQELQEPFDRGVVSIADLGFGMDYLIEQHTNGWTGDTRQYAQRWADLLSTRLGDGRTHLLFDQESGDLARQLIAEGEVNPGQLGIRLAGRAAIGAGFVASLPTMPGAPMDELLTVREELAVPLDRFRAAVAALADQLPQTVGTDLEVAVADLWDSQGWPGLTQLQEELREHSYPRELAQHLGLSATDFLSAAPVYLGLGSVAGMSELLTGLTSLGVTAGGRVGGEAWRARRGVRESARRHDFFYLYRLDQRLRDRLNADDGRR